MSQELEENLVESNQAEAGQPVEAAPVETPVVEKVQAAPAPAAPATVDKRVVGGSNVVADAEKRRKVQALELQRERILSERTSSAHRRTALSNALADIEEKLAELGWTIHL